MTEKFASVLCAVAVVAGLVASPVYSSAADGAVDPGLQAKLEALSAGSGGTLGVFARDVRTGRMATVHAQERFPMASTYKLPIALAVLDAVDRGRLRLDQALEIRKEDLAPGFSPIAEEWNPGMSRTVESLLRSMVVESDNTASDVLMTAAGGAATVSGRLRSLGIVDMDVNRTEVEMAADFYGVALPAQRDLDSLADRFKDAPRENRAAGAARFAKDPRDTTTPAAMGQLLGFILEGKGASADGIARLRSLMKESRGPAPRLAGGIPEGMALEHKTGTCGSGFGFSCFNDVGILTTAGGRPIIVAVYLKSSTKPDADKNRVLAEVARAVVDAWGR